MASEQQKPCIKGSVCVAWVIQISVRAVSYILHCIFFHVYTASVDRCTGVDINTGCERHDLSGTQLYHTLLQEDLLLSTSYNAI